MGFLQGMIIGLVLATPHVLVCLVLFGLRRAGRIAPQTDRRVYAFSFFATLAFVCLLAMYHAHRSFEAAYGATVGQAAEGVADASSTEEASP